MKKLSISIIFALLLVASVFAQSVPQGMKYQAVARDLSGDIMANQQVFLQVQLQSNINSQQVYYSENHIVTTNQFGLFSLVIGEGVSNKGDFTKIPWSTDDIWMGVAIKDGKKNNYATISNSKLLAVPYAFHAASASKLTEEKGNNGIGNTLGVPAKVWSLKGNRKTDPEIDKMGTTDYTDLVFVTDNLERLRIDADGKITFVGSLDVAEDLYVGRDVFLNYNDTISPRGKTINHGDFSVNGKMTVDNDSNLNGQVTIKAELEETDQNNYDAYPLRIEGSEQGIAIKINGNAPTRNQNWITFMGADGEPLGRIEGTFGIIREIAKDVVETIIKGPSGDGVWEVVTENRTFDLNKPGDILDIRDIYFNNSYTEGLRDLAIEQMKSFKDFVIDAAGAGGTACTLGDCDDIIKKAIDLVIGRLKILAYMKSGTDAGAAFESGGADYAEWLKKAYPNERISFGEVVGIKGGQISKTFTDANQFVTITSNPIIVGAMPKKGSENNFKKVALMGQVPTLVIGRVNIGDYILPSGNGDGIARAVNPKEMKATDFSKIIGVAWSNSDNKNMFNYINTAVGFNANQMGMMVNNMQIIMNKMQDEIAKLNPEYKPVYFNTNEKGEKQTTNLEVTEYSLAVAGCDSCGDKIGIDVFKCYVKCWVENVNNGNDINPDSNAIRRIIKRKKSLNGEDIDIVVELIQKRAKTKIKEPIQGFMDKLFEVDGFIDIDNQFEGYPEIQDLLNNIKELNFEEFNFSVLKDKIESIIDRIQVLSQLLDTE